MAKVVITVEDTAYGIVDADVDFDPHIGDDRNWTLAQQIAMEMLEVVSREHAHNFEVRKTLKQENS